MDAAIVTIVVLTCIVILTIPVVLVFLVCGLRGRVAELQREQERMSTSLVGVARAVEKLSAPAGGREKTATVAPAPSEPRAKAAVEKAPLPAPSAKAAVRVAAAAAEATKETPRAVSVLTRMGREAVAATPVKPAAPPPVESKPSRLRQTVGQILREGWNWLLVNEKYRPSGVTAEYAVATTWMTRVGIMVFVLGIAFGLKWSIDRGWLGEEVRTAMAMVSGVVMAAGGTWLARKRTYNLLGQGFMGGGIVTLYFSAYAASPMYHLIPVSAAYGLMILVTITAGFLAVRSNSMLVGILGIVGGYLTPALLSTDSGNLGGLYAYMLILSLGILGVAHYRRWRLMNFLALSFTYIIVYTSLPAHFTHDKFVVCLVLISALFLAHSSVVFIQSLIAGRHTGILEVMHLVINSLAYGSAAYWLVAETHGSRYPAIVTVALGAFYVMHVLLFMRKKLVDRPLLTTLLALSGLYTALTLPIVFERETLTVSLALLALMFLWLGRRMKSHFVENLAHALYLIVFYRLLFLDTWRSFPLQPSAETTFAEYWRAMSHRLSTFGVSIASVITAFFLQKRWQRPAGAPEVGVENDTRTLVPESTAGHALFWFAALFVFLVLHLELNCLFAYYTPLRLPVLTVLWCLASFAFLWRYLQGSIGRTAMLCAALVFLGGAVSKVLSVDLRSWHFVEHCYYAQRYAFLDAGMRLVDFGSLLALAFGAWYLVRGRSDTRALSPVFGFGGLLLLFIFLSLEVNSFLHWRVPDFQTGGISVLWALFAIAFIGGGLWKNVRALRYTGLLLFGVVIGKVFLLDLKDTPIAYRVIAFLIVGAALLLGSFAYMRANQKFIRQE